MLIICIIKILDCFQIFPSTKMFLTFRSIKIFNFGKKYNARKLMLLRLFFVDLSCPAPRTPCPALSNVSRSPVECHRICIWIHPLNHICLPPSLCQSYPYRQFWLFIRIHSIKLSLLWLCICVWYMKRIVSRLMQTKLFK